MTKDEALKMAIEWMEKIALDVPDKYDDEGIKVAIALYEALAQPAQEPVAMYENGNVNWINTPKDNSLLYTHPAPSWQGLTAKEIASIPLNEYTVQTVERMLKEKNT